MCYLQTGHDFSLPSHSSSSVIPISIVSRILASDPIFKLTDYRLTSTNKGNCRNKDALNSAFPTFSKTVCVHVCRMVTVFYLCQGTSPENYSLVTTC
jgi:hypothetical protein